MHKVVLVLLSIVPGFAQMPGNLIPGSRMFPVELKQYLALSDAQVTTILGLNQDYTRIMIEKSMRQAQVQREIAEWTAEETLDPMALGLRYTELEVIRRELRDAMAETRQKVLAALDNNQKTKLKALEDAMKLQAVIAQAQCENLIATPRIPSSILPVQSGDFTFTPGGVTTGIIVGLPANCSAVGVIRDPIAMPVTQP